MERGADFPPGQGESDGMGFWTRRLAPLVWIAVMWPPPTLAAGVAVGLLPPSYHRDDAPDPAAIKRGTEIYSQICSACHEQGLGRAPQRDMLRYMTPESVDRALTEGVMRAQAAGLSAEDIRMVSEYIADRKMGEKPIPPLMCKAGASPFLTAEPPPFSGWGLTPDNSHAIPTRVAGIGRADVARLKLKWALVYPAAVRARSQPAVAGGAIFVGSHNGDVFALDRATGCARWIYRAAAEVRTGIVVSPWRVHDAVIRPTLYFGDIVGNIYAVNARTGALVWKFRADPHPSVTITATPVLHGHRLYVGVSSLEEGRPSDPHYECCTFRGSVLAVDAATGDPIWRTYMTDPPTPQGVNSVGARRLGPSGVAIWSSLAVDEKRGRLYVDTGDNYSSPASKFSDAIVALDMKTGAIDWSYQALSTDVWNLACSQADLSNCPSEKGPDFDFGAGVVLGHASDGHDYVLAGQKSGTVFAVDPDTGALKWKTKVGRGGLVGGVHFGMAQVGDTLYVPVSDLPDGRVYDEPARPGLYALDIRTGKYVWKAPATDVCGGKPLCHPGYGAAITATPELVFAGSDDGHLRIYDAADGKVLWDFDTDRPATGVNGALGHGGAMGGGSAPIAYKGDLVVNSGYAFIGAMPGNLLLVFGAR
jgi:polyvinyl alcohol dehydrogenase (cytochrome)